jgi:hypothetical protein
VCEIERLNTADPVVARPFHPERERVRLARTALRLARDEHLDARGRVVVGNGVGRRVTEHQQFVVRGERRGQPPADWPPRSGR